MRSICKGRLRCFFISRKKGEMLRMTNLKYQAPNDG